MAKACSYCTDLLVWPNIFSCYYCKRQYCGKHRIPEYHECPKVMAAKHIERDYLRKKGVNITTGKYAAVCRACGFTSNFMDIEEANQTRIDHIREKGCDGKLVQLRQHEDDVRADTELVKVETEKEDVDGWMYECLKEARTIVEKYDIECMPGFLQDATFSLYIQNDNEHAYGYITLTEGSKHYPIGIHPALSENNSRNARMLIVVLVHELLHAIHPDWSHDRINPKERLLANKAGYFDALREMELLAVNGRMRFCQT